MKTKKFEGVSGADEIAASTDLADFVILNECKVKTDAQTSTIAGTALRLRVSEGALEVTGRDKRVKHRFGVYQDGGDAIGTIALYIDRELYVASLDLGALEVRSAIAEACSAKRLPVVLLGADGKTELLLLTATEDLRRLWDASQVANVMDVPSFMRMLGAVTRNVIGTLVVEMLKQDRASIRAVRSSYAMSEVLVADLERRLWGNSTLQ